MAKTLLVRRVNQDPDLRHEFRNLGEDVFRELRDEYEVSLQAIDRAELDFPLPGLPKRELRRVAARVRKVAEKSWPMVLPLEFYEVDEDTGAMTLLA